MPQKILRLVGPVHIVGGLLLFLTGFLPSLETPLAALTALPPQTSWSPFFAAVLGPTIASWGVLFTATTQRFFVAPSPALWKAMAWSLAIWAPLDSGLCLYYGVYRGAILNAAVVIVIAVLLLLARPSITVARAGESAKPYGKSYRNGDEFKTPALETLEILRAGNRRFAAGTGNLDSPVTQRQRSELVDDQRPIAVVLGCSDSRVPVEIVFDQSLGKLFVIRVAGNVVAASQIGSVEFAARQSGLRLVVVLGHSRCGAIKATLEELQRPTENQSPNLHTIVSRIRPSLENLLREDSSRDLEALQRQAVRANVRASVNKLRHGSAVIEQHIKEEGLLVVGAEYSLETGLVDFFEV